MLLLSASIAVLHPQGIALVQEIQKRYPHLAKNQLSLQVLLDLMICIARDWNSNSAILIPFAALIGRIVTKATHEPEEDCPDPLAQEMWEFLECIHADVPANLPLQTSPSRN
jgi:hypothetical protein